MLQIVVSQFTYLPTTTLIILSGERDNYWLHQILHDQRFFLVFIFYFIALHPTLGWLTFKYANSSSSNTNNNKYLSNSVVYSTSVLPFDKTSLPLPNPFVFTHFVYQRYFFFLFLQSVVDKFILYFVFFFYILFYVFYILF